MQLAVTSRLVLLLLAWYGYGCATLFNGSSQEVPVDVPLGTKVTTAGGVEIPVYYKFTRRDSSSYLRLDRDVNYYLRFSYKGQQVTAAFESNFEAIWLLLNYIPYGYIVDGITGAWNSFDGLAVRFPDDTSQRPFLESYRPDLKKKIGITLIASTGYAFPIGNKSPEYIPWLNYYQFGAGYQVLPRLLILGEYSRGGRVNVMPRYSDYRTYGNFKAYSLGARFKFQDDIYLCAGGGLADVWTNELIYHDTPRISPGSAKHMGSFYAGIGYSGKYGYMEVRHTAGLSDIALTTGENGHFDVTLVAFGVNLHF